MRLSTKLSLSLVFITVAVLGSYGYRRSVREEGQLRASAVHDLRLLGAALEGALDDTDLDSHATAMPRILSALELSDSEVDVVVCDRVGRATLSSRYGQRTQALVRELVQRSLAQRIPLVEFAGPAGLSYLVGVFPVHDQRGQLKGAVALVQPLDELRRLLEEARVATLLSVAVLALSLSAVVVLLVWIYVRAPLGAIMKAMRRVRAGDLSASVPVSGLDEMGELAAEFNRMLAELRDARARLAEEADSRRSLEQALLRVDKLVTVGQLSAGLAHEIGSPLQVLSGRARLIAARADLPPDVVRNANLLEQQCDRITRIVEQLLAYARRRTARHEPLDVAIPVRGVIELLEYEARHRGLGLVLQFDGERTPGELTVERADSDQLQQLTFNLVNNALRATKSGGTVTVQLSRSRFRPSGAGDERESVRLSVADKGVGMSKTQMARIFEPFFTSWAEGGTGLGLAVVRAIVDEHQGLIEVRSVEGEGTEISVHIPLVRLGGAEAAAS